MIESNIMAVALQLTAIDVMKGVIARVPNVITSLGNASKEVKNDFDDMNTYVFAEFKPPATLVNEMSETIMETEKES